MSRPEHALVILFRGDPRREEREKRLPHRFLSTVQASLLNIVSSVRDVDILIARDVGDDFEVGDRRWCFDSLADRIDAAVGHGFSLGYSRVLLLAGDIVDIDRSAIESAIAAVDDVSGSAAVVGLSGDGGFYAAGFNRQPEVSWSRLLDNRSCSGAALIEALSAEGFAIAMLPRVDDIDDAADAARATRLRRPLRSFLRLVARLESLLSSSTGCAAFLERCPADEVAFSFNFRGPPHTLRTL